MAQLIFEYKKSMFSDHLEICKSKRFPRVSKQQIKQVQKAKQHEMKIVPMVTEPHSISTGMHA